jgi:hypothetical protein
LDDVQPGMENICLDVFKSWYHLFWYNSNSMFKEKLIKRPALLMSDELLNLYV